MNICHMGKVALQTDYLPEKFDTILLADFVFEITIIPLFSIIPNPNHTALTFQYGFVPINLNYSVICPMSLFITSSYR